MEFIAFMVKEYAGSEIILVIAVIVIIVVYAKFVRPSYKELKDYRTKYKGKLDSLLTKENLDTTLRKNFSLKEVTELLNQIKSDIVEIKSETIEEITNLKSQLLEDVKKIESELLVIKDDLIEHHEELVSVREIVEEIKTSCINLYNITDKTLSQLEDKHIIDKVERVDLNSIQKIQQTTTELNSIFNVLKETLEKSSKPRKLDRV